MLRQRLLFHGEGNWLGRGRHFRNHRPCNHGPGGHRARRTRIYAQNAGLRGRNRRSHRHRGAMNFALGNPHCMPAHRLRIYQYGVRHRCNCPRHGLVCVVDVYVVVVTVYGGDSCDIGGVVRDVVVVGDVRDVGDARIADVHVVKIIPAGSVGRNVRLAVAQGEPRDPAAAAETHTYTQVASAHPRDQRRCIDRADPRWPWHPTPVSTVENPSSIVARRETPRRVVHPGPAPRFHPHPVPVAIRSPTRIDSRYPNRAVGGQHTPRTVVIEVFGANHIG